MIILDDRRKQVLDMLVREPFRIGLWCGFKDLSSLHNGWLRSFLYGKESQTLLAHRGSFKTTVLSLFLAIHLVERPNENVILFRKTDDDVSEVIAQTKNVLFSGAMQQVVLDLYGVRLRGVKDRATEIHTNLCTYQKGASQILGLGIGTSITGKHADVVVTDDIVNLKDRVSRAERERTRLQYMELQNICNRNGRFINTGTPWHKDDAIGLMPNVSRFDCYHSGLIARDELDVLRHSMSDSLFAANYELKHIADADALFRDPQFSDDAEGLFGGQAHVDASFGGADGTAYTIMRERPDGSIIALGKLWHRHVDDCLDQIGALHQVYRVGSTSLETNADKGYLSREFQKRGMPVSSYFEHTNKFIKISTYLRKDWSRIRWLKDTDPEYINEILDYNENAAHDDCPDSAASLLRRFQTKVRYNADLNGGV